LATKSTTAIKSKQRWERLEVVLEVASIGGGVLLTVGLWLEGWKGLGAKLVIVGVAIEVFVSGWVLLASRKLQTIQERALEEMRYETAQANARAEEASRDAAESNRIAAEANLEVARLNLEIERLQAPRILNLKQRDQAINELRAAVTELIPYGSLRVEIFTVDNDDEVIRLRDQLCDILQQAGWIPRMNLNRRPTILPVNGVTVELQTGTTVRQLRSGHANNLTFNLGPKALALVSALRRAGLEVSGPFPTSNMVTDASIEIIVGNKPQ
jgi:hypothetical protein